MKNHLKNGLQRAVAGLCLCFALATNARAATTFDFESTNPLSSALVSGDKSYFGITTEQAKYGSQSIKFVDPGPEYFESWTYDLPFSLTSGTISLWFYDANGTATLQANPTLAKWGGSIILEDKNSPADFGAVEISELPYGGGRYYGSEGNTDRQTASFIFDSANFPLRTVGWHKVEFQIGATESIITVDGLASTRVGAPGGNKTLRLRVMDGSAGNGSAPVGTPGLPPGYQPNWYLTTVPFAPPTRNPWVSYDDLTISAQTPSAQTHTMGFEVSPTPPAESYDRNAIPFPVPISAYDNIYMKKFVNQWDVTTSASFVRTGTQAAYYRNPAPSFKSIAFDLSSVTAGNAVTLWFYDTRGPENSQTEFGGTVAIENGTTPSEFLGVEIWNFPYPASGDPTPGGPNYYLTRGSSSGTPVDSFDSRIFGNRTISWHKVVITVNATDSTITVDGIGDATRKGPGLNKNPKLRIMADSATAGGFANYTNVDELGHVYFATRSPYVYYDQVIINDTPSAAVEDWSIYE
ncbi:MAG: hypothetical protein K1X53_15880 [Candidatus Sumerlaeaceae bacterium]|nr:hypothetical protein [Candidatus Sumerlaeaceae bacterium]